MEKTGHLRNFSLKGGKVSMRKIEKKDLALCMKWFGDPDVVKFLSNGTKNITEEMELDWFNFIESSDNDLVFAIISRRYSEYIGNCGLHKIDWNEKTCEFGMFIGNKDYWNRGYGTDALKTVIDFAFRELGLQTIKLLVYEYNHRAMRVYENCGFVLVDTLKKHHLYNDIYWDTFVMEKNAII